MNQPPGTANRILVAALWIAVGVYAATVTHDFFRYIDRSIFVSVDDSEANIAYSIAEHGRYGFPASPVLAGLDRSQGQFNYGPWYFYFAGGLTWLLGFSLTLVRSIHLWAVIGTIGLAAAWFNGRDRAAIAVFYGLGILYCFEASHWPMARPDIFVSVFALLVVVFGGRGVLRGAALDWMLAGLAAAAGAFTHLIAFTLVPSAAAICVAAQCLTTYESTDRSKAWPHAVRSVLALIGGMALGSMMFYASFGFDFATQWRFLTAYRELTASPVSFSVALGHHLTYAFGYLPDWGRVLVWMTLGLGWMGSLFSLRMPPEQRRDTIAALLPPVVIWTAYMASSGYYTNYHQGYSILHQVMFLWTLTALVWLVLKSGRERYPLGGAVIAALVTLALFVQSGRLIAWQLSGESWKAQRIAAWVPFAEYSSRVLDAIPARATAWGSIIFGLEAPDRIQLVQWSDATTLMGQIPEPHRPALRPDFIVWSYPEMRDNMLSTTRGGPTLLAKTEELMGDAEMRMVSMVAASPYGVTRTYARRVGPLDPARSLPTVSVYDADRRRWLTRLGEPLPAAFVPTDPIALRIGYEKEPPVALPTRTVQAELPADRYLLKVRLTAGSGARIGRLLTATSPNMLKQTKGEGGPDGDFVSYSAGDTEIYMLLIHTGGPLRVSQFDTGAGAAIESVTAYPIVGLLDPRESPLQARELPALKSWTPTKDVTVREVDNTLRIEGDASAGGYQLMSPLINVRARHRVTVQSSLDVQRGRVCVGALNGTGATWLVPPDSLRTELRFTMDASQGFRVVLANCNPEANVVKSQFALWTGTYLDDPAGEDYADRLVSAALYPSRLEESDQVGPEVQTAPPGLSISRAALEGPIAPLTLDDLSYRAALVQQQGAGWSIQGRGEGQYTYLLQSKEQRLDTHSRFVVRGRVERGGISIGLLRNNAWTSQINVTDPGEFTVVIAPPARGSYSLMLANNLTPSLETSIVLTKFGLLTR